MAPENSTYIMSYSHISHKISYYTFKIFPHFWLVKTTCIIHHNQLLLTKFGKNFVILNQWRQNNVKSEAWLKVIEPLTAKTWAGMRLSCFGTVVRTKWRNSRWNSLLVSRWNVVLKHGKTNDICYLEYICRPEQTFKYVLNFQIEMHHWYELTSTKVSMF